MFKYKISNNHKKVIVAMSGGVDSSVAAWLLQQSGYQVEGLFMKNWEEDDNEQYCSSAKDLSDTQAVCDKLDIKLHKVNFSAEYWNNVFKYVLLEYQYGLTPNPDILCNKEIKFKTFLKFAKENLNANFIATGHYVRCKNFNGKNHLLRGIDNTKDQSYFLYTISDEQLSQTLFPIGNLKKTKVRYIAKRLNLITANKKDSTGLCFIGKRNFNKFLSRYLPAKPGNITTIDGCIIGKHQGLIFFTIGQRKGLGIGGIKNNKNDPWYVVGKDMTHNNLIVAQGKDNKYLMSMGLVAKKLYFVNRKTMSSQLNCTVQTRYRQTDIPCTIIPYNHDYITVRFSKPIIGVTPGQSAVFYRKDICIGGGIITKSLPYFLKNFNNIN